jgi:hypothetical protein
LTAAACRQNNIDTQDDGLGKVNVSILYWLLQLSVTGIAVACNGRKLKITAELAACTKTTQQVRTAEVQRFDLFFLFDFSPQFMFYRHEEFTPGGYKNLYIFFYRSLFLRETLTRRREAKKNSRCHTRKRHARNQQPQEPGCGGFTGRDALPSPAARPISMSPSASSCCWWW